MPRESWGVLECSDDDEGDQSAGENRAPVFVIGVRSTNSDSQPEESTDWQAITPSWGGGRVGGEDAEEEGVRRKRGKRGG